MAATTTATTATTAKGRTTSKGRKFGIRIKNSASWWNGERWAGRAAAKSWSTPEKAYEAARALFLGGRIVQKVEIVGISR